MQEKFLSLRKLGKNVLSRRNSFSDLRSVLFTSVVMGEKGTSSVLKKKNKGRRKSLSNINHAYLDEKTNNNNRESDAILKKLQKEEAELREAEKKLKKDERKLQEDEAKYKTRYDHEDFDEFSDEDDDKDFDENAYEKNMKVFLKGMQEEELKKQEQWGKKYKKYQEENAAIFPALRDAYQTYVKDAQPKGKPVDEIWVFGERYKEEKRSKEPVAIQGKEKRPELLGKYVPENRHSCWDAGCSSYNKKGNKVYDLSIWTENHYQAELEKANKSKTFAERVDASRHLKIVRDVL